MFFYRECISRNTWEFLKKISHLFLNTKHFFIFFSSTQSRFVVSFHSTGYEVVINHHLYTHAEPTEWLTIYLYRTSTQHIRNPLNFQIQLWSTVWMCFLTTVLILFNTLLHLPSPPTLNIRSLTSHKSSYLDLFYFILWTKPQKKTYK